MLSKILLLRVGDGRGQGPPAGRQGQGGPRPPNETQRHLTRNLKLLTEGVSWGEEDISVPGRMPRGEL